MKYPLFSEIGSENDPVLDAYEITRLKGDVRFNPLDAAVLAYVNQNGGAPDSAEVQIAVRDYLIGALIPQIHNLWNYFKDASRESEQYKKFFEEKMDEVAKLRAVAIQNEMYGKFTFDDLSAGGGDGEG